MIFPIWNHNFRIFVLSGLESEFSDFIRFGIIIF